MAEPKPRVRPKREAAKSNYDGTYYCGACEEDTWVQAQDEIKCWKCQTEVMYKKEATIDQRLVPEGVLLTPEILAEAEAEGAAAGVPATIVEVPVAYLDAKYICANCGEENEVKVASDETLRRMPIPERFTICLLEMPWNCFVQETYTQNYGVSSSLKFKLSRHQDSKFEKSFGV